MKIIRFLKDFMDRGSENLIDVRDYKDPDVLTCSEVIEILKKMNPDALCLGEYDGSVYAIPTPKQVKLTEIWGASRCTGPNFFIEEEDTEDGLIYKQGYDAVIF